MKYMIEIEDEPFGRNDDTNIPHGMDELYRAKGFNALVFDKNGLDKLTTLDEALKEAYQKGYDTGSHEATTLEYQQGLNDAWGTIIKIALIPYAERSEIFDGKQDILSIVKKFSPSEVAAKLREYGQPPEPDGAALLRRHFNRRNPQEGGFPGPAEHPREGKAGQDPLCVHRAEKRPVFLLADREGEVRA